MTIPSPSPRSLALSVLALLVAAMQSACSPGPGNACIPNARAACSCPGGAASTRVCDADGTAFGACACVAAGVDAGRTDSSSPGSQCGTAESCADCTGRAGCGWCNGACEGGTAAGPTGTSCSAWNYGTCTAPPVACSSLTTCGACTPEAGCGWCGATGRCATGTASGPSAGACASGWAWTTSECAAASCAAPRQLCNGACVDVQTDQCNCGGCGSDCEQEFYSCVAGHCTPPSEASSDGCGMIVGTAWCGACHGGCVNTDTDASNCGGCGHACAAGQTCTSGLCCAAGATCTCGNHRCEPTEDCHACPGDCGACLPVPRCGDGTCNGSETYASCPSDCTVCGAAAYSVFCSAGLYCLEDSTCVGGGCPCNPGYIALGCDGLPCTTSHACAYPNAHCERVGCGLANFTVSISGGHTCPTNAHADPSGAGCDCDAGFVERTCDGYACSTAHPCDAPNWWCAGE